MIELPRKLVREQLLQLLNNERGKELLEIWKHWRTAAYLLSYPKCGRTWLRMMIGRGLATEFGLSVDNPMEIGKLHRLHPAIPRVRVSHEWVRGAPIPTSKQRYASKTVILLVRDPRDVVVSMYFQASKRLLDKQGTGRSTFTEDLSTFLRGDRVSLTSIIDYYNSWANGRHIPRTFTVVRYEDLHATPEAELARVFGVMGVRVSEPSLREAVAYSRFDNMRKLEENNAFGSNRLKPGDVSDPESFKTRKGEVGGYRKYMSEADIDYVNAVIREQLSPFYNSYF